MTGKLEKLRKTFEEGKTRSYAFRKEQLKALKSAVLRFEKEIEQALYEDLKKNREESWVTETGFLVAEINHCLRQLKRWMKPERVPTNLLNFPSKSYIYKEPKGVVLIIGPWNYPLQLLLTPLTGAIAAGNCMVLKPSEFSRATTVVMEKIITSVFPGDYILYEQGDGAVIVPEMMESFRFDHVFFTGSIPVGRRIYEMAARKLVPVTLELGGKSPCIIESDAHIPVAARRIVLAKFSNAGQMCVAPDYLLIHEKVKKELIEEIKKVIREFYSDDPYGSYHFGKIINEKQFKRLLGYLGQGRIILGGRSNPATLQIEPTLLENLPPDAPIMRDEIFGPILPVFTFRDLDEAKAIINKNPDPLAFYLFTRNHDKEELWLEQIPFGGGCINNTSWHLTNFNLPFGGRGNSGIGAYHGRYSFDLFSHAKAVMKTPTWFDPGIKYPPFKGKLGLFKKIIR